MQQPTTLFFRQPDAGVADMMRKLDEVIERLERIEQGQAVSRAKEAYTTEEAAARLNKSEWTVRQWCNKGQVRGARKILGKGRTGEWRLPHDAIAELQANGPQPIGTFKSNAA